MPAQTQASERETPQLPPSLPSWGVSSYPDTAGPPAPSDTGGLSLPAAPNPPRPERTGSLRGRAVSLGQLCVYSAQVGPGSAHGQGIRPTARQDGTNTRPRTSRSRGARWLGGATASDPGGIVRAALFVGDILTAIDHDPNTAAACRLLGADIASLQVLAASLFV